MKFLFAFDWTQRDAVSTETSIIHFAILLLIDVFHAFEYYFVGRLAASIQFDADCNMLLARFATQGLTLLCKL